MKHIYTDTFEHISLQVGWAIQVGKDHKENGQPNADTVKVLHGPDLDIPDGQPAGLLILADGVGGEASAARASKLIVQSVTQKVRECIKNHTVSLADLPDKTLYDVMVQAALSAHETVLDKGNGGQSTYVGALWVGQRVFISYIGDSRAYLARSSGLQRTTKDHSLVQTRYIDGLGLSEQKAWKMGLRYRTNNVLVKAAGAKFDISSSDVLPKVKQSKEWVAKEGAWVMRDREWLLLCSDGLWSVLRDDQMFSIVTGAKTPRAACDQLVSAAQQARSDDDISVIVAGLRAS